MSATPRKVFVNLPIRNLDESVKFFTALGFEFNAQFSDESSTCMIVNDDAAVMLLVDERFSDFTNKPIVDAAAQTEVILAISTESREAVDEMVNTALAAGGKPSKDPQDHGFMYGWSFQDIDGHLWEVLYMDPNAAQQ